MFHQIVFYSLAAMTLLSALAVVTMRNTVHSALMLGVTLLGVAGLFAMLGADFLFGGQIMVYVGGIALLVMFVVMLLGRASDLHLRQVNNQWAAAFFICAVSSVGLWRVIRGFAHTAAPVPASPTTAAIGRLLLGDYAVPFEVVSLLLTAALLGAVFFSEIERKS